MLEYPLTMAPATKDSRKATADAKAVEKATLQHATSTTLVFALWLVVLNVIAVYLFASGFLLTRPVLEDIAVDGGVTGLPRPFKRAVVVVIDALRQDFITGSGNMGENYFSDALVEPVLRAVSEPENAAVYKFVADPPTTTLQRLKALTTGSLPTFVDAGSNFHGSAVSEDSWIRQLLNENKRVAFAGDDTWISLFPALGEDGNISFPYESFNVWDLDTVDAGVTSHLVALLAEREKWDVLIAHYLGVDHAGHRYGPDTPQMKTKLTEMNDVIRFVLEALKDDEDTLLVVLGDHGMDDKGDHGGDSQGEIEAGLFLYSARQFLAPFDDIETVNQIDIVPTLSILLGLAVPFSNLGTPILAPMLGPSVDEAQLASALYLVSQQISNYRASHPSFSVDVANITRLYDIAVAAWDGKLEPDMNYNEVAELHLEFQRANLRECREMWARFDLPSISMGIVVFALTTLVAVYFYFSFDGTAACASDYLGPLLIKIGIAGITGGVAGAVAGLTHHGPLNSGLFYTAISSILACIFGIAKLRLGTFCGSNAWTMLALFIAFAHGTVFASNSFVVWEGSVVSFIVVSVGFVLLLAALRLDSVDVQVRFSAVFNAVVFIVLARLAAYPVVCREEQLPYCTTNFYKSTASSTSSLAATIAALVVALVLPSLVRSFLGTSKSYEGAAPLWIGIGMRFVLLLVGLYWALDFVEADTRSLVTSEQMRPSKFVISRVVLGIAIVGAPFAWIRACPLCLKIEMQNNQDKIRRAVQSGDVDTASKTMPVSVQITGFGNTYGALYLLLFLSVLCGVMLCTKPVGIVALAVFTYQMLTLLELADTLELPMRAPLVVATLLPLMATQYFFATGHQATLSSIQWDVAFIFTETIRAPLPHLALVFNTFGSYLLAGLAVPLSVLYKLSPSPKDRHASEVAMSRVLRACVGSAVYTGIVVLANCVLATVLRRHLMVWKIFAPRVMLAGAGLLVFDIAMLLAMCIAERSIAGVFDVFG
ncbi:uncharacterized protein V1518DRAFT_422610 [Limtongia smithiae]|uniref:uncharacterized protein n=1 Tax=Limtongia smithiae TaxID=1125753 RepID=UPI0034CE12E9